MRTKSGIWAAGRVIGFGDMPPKAPAKPQLRLPNRSIELVLAVIHGISMQILRLPLLEPVRFSAEVIGLLNASAWMKLAK